jgi:hypothetical protein
VCSVDWIAWPAMIVLGNVLRFYDGECELGNAKLGRCWRGKVMSERSGSSRDAICMGKRGDDHV